MSSRPPIVLAGATGFLGTPLARALARPGADIVVLTRRAPARLEPPLRALRWTPDGTLGDWAAVVDGAAAVINLAGEPIAARRWSAAQKARIHDSRVLATRSLVAAVAAARTPPPVFASASGIGYYGPHEDDVVTEDAANGDDFMARVCADWETEARRATSRQTRVVCIRSGLVVERDGGALARMLLPFRLGVGGRVGTGRQYWSWIHREDWVQLVIWAIEHDAVTGGLNATAPTPVTNAEFTRALGRALRRPALFPAPAVALRLAFGEMADALLLSGQRVVPERALRGGFAFRYQQIDDALRAIFNR